MIKNIHLRAFMKFMLFAVFSVLLLGLSITAYRFAQVKFLQFNQMEKQAVMLTDKVSQLSHLIKLEIMQLLLMEQQKQVLRL